MKCLKNFIELCEEDIRSGKIFHCQNRLSSLNTTQIIENQRLPLANLCRRSNLIHLGLRLLAPLVHRERKKIVREPTSEELCEYAVLLIRVGAVREAFKILNSLNPHETPKVYLYKSFCYFNEWNYPMAIEPLEQYLTYPLEDYDKLIAKINLAAAAFYSQDFVKSQFFSQEVYNNTKGKNKARLRANSLELLALISIEQNFLEKAQVYIDEAQKLLTTSNTFDQLFVEGCSAFLQAKKTGDLGSLKEYRQKALERKRFESVREADWFLLRLSFQQELLDQLYYGTPYVFLRKRFEETVSKKVTPGPFYLGESGPTLDLVKGEWKGQNLKIDSKVFLTLSILLKDHYRPASVGRIFSEVFPEEYFDPDYSPRRVRQVIYRTRLWLKENAVPLEITNDKKFYHFNLKKSLRLCLSENPLLEKEEQYVFNLLEKKYKSLGGFTFTSAHKELDLKKSCLRKAIQEALSQGAIEKFGAGPKTEYIFISSYSAA